MKRTITILAAGAALVAAAYVLLLLALAIHSPLKLRVSWEGPVIGHNFRDVGESLNQCLGEKRFATGVLLRANRWFSGWSCEEVGSPDVILTLNYKPENGDRYFCRSGLTTKVGEVYAPTTELSDLEFLQTWQNPVMRSEACAYVSRALEVMAHGEKLLVHCDAGRDRTGTLSALLAAMAIEQNGPLDEGMMKALECDYRKSKSLSPEKYGRMRTFISALTAEGGIARFLGEQCGIPADHLKAAAQRFAPTFD